MSAAVLREGGSSGAHLALYAYEDGGEVFAEGWQAGWCVPEPIPVDEWADLHRFLPKTSSSEYGQWRTERTPYLREPMQVLSAEHPSKKAVMMAGTQVGKTEVGNNWYGSMIHQNPGPAMAVQPTVDLGKRWGRQRFNPMVECSSVLRKLIKSAKSRDSGNTAQLKEYPGGMLIITGANSAASLRSMPVKFLFLDEVDAYPSDVEGDGHPVDLAERRTSTFPRRKVFIASTPTVKDESIVEEEFKHSDQRHYHVPCPHCGHMQVLRDENLTDDGTFICEAEGHVIEEHHKTQMLEWGRWIAKNPDSDIPGFHLPSYYAPIGLGYSWAEIAEMRVKAKDNPEKWKTYINTIMAETYEDESGKVDWRDLKARAGSYAARTIPDGCMMLTAGVDIQDDRFAVILLGWGRSEKIWVIDWFEVPFDPSLDEEWGKLDKHVLDASFTNKYGVTMQALSVGIDTGGHHTHMAYNYARTRAHRRVLAIKGSRYPNKPIIATRPSKRDINVRGSVLQSGVELWSVGTDTAKGSYYAKLHTDALKAANDETDFRINFPRDLPDDFYQQLTAERYDTTRQRWIHPRHKRNEATDCFVYGYAAACHPEIRVNMLKEKDWDKIEEKIQPVIADMFGDQVVSQETNLNAEPANDAVSKLADEMVAEKKKEVPKTLAKKKRKKVKRGSGGFVSGRRG